MTGEIGYAGSKATYSMIRFLDNTSDASGNGISVSAPSHGLYILYVTDGVNGIMRKIRL